MPQEQARLAAPYLPWKSFFNSLEVFSQAIPPKLTRSVWRQSGLMQGLLLGTYRFLGLVDEDDKPTGLLVVLINPETRQEAMAGILRASYPAIVAHNMNSITIEILNEEMEKYNVSGSTKKKAITFFLQAAKYAGFPLSSFIQLRTSGPRRRRSRVEEEEFADETPTPSSRSGTEKVVELKSGGKITLKVEIDVLSVSEADRKFVFEMVDKLNGYGAPVRPKWAQPVAE